MSAYFPYPLEDLRALGLITERLPTRLGTVLVYRVGPDAPVTTVFLHGVGLDSSAWSALLRAAREEGEPTEGWVYVDVPGFGGSDRLDRGISLGDAAGAVVDVLDGLGAREPVHVVGHSMGGFLALHLVAEHPARTARLTTVCGAYSTVVAAVNRPGRALLLAPRATATYGLIALVARLGRAGTALLRLGARTGLLRLSLAGLAAHPSRVPASLLAALAEDNRPESFLLAEASGERYDCAAVWSTITRPVVAVFGERDVLVSARDRDLLARSLPDARTVVVPDSAHLLPLERPHELLRLARKLDR